MSVQQPVFELALPLADTIRACAARVYPEECCGLIEGVCTELGWRALAIHETPNVAADRARRFEIDPAAQFRLLRALRETPRDIVGCFHSHPGGAADISPADLEGAGEHGFVWVVAGGDPQIGFRLAAHMFDAVRARFAPAALRTV